MSAFVPSSSYYSLARFLRAGGQAHVNKMLRVVSAAAKSAGVVCGAPGGARTTGRDFGLRIPNFCMIPTPSGRWRLDCPAADGGNPVQRRVRSRLAPPAESQQTFGSSQYRWLPIEAAWCYRFL